MGTTVHDEATVNGDGVIVPTGDVDFTWFANGSCEGEGTPSGTNIALDGSGVAHPSSSQTPIAAGSYAFRASYSGDDNYNPSISACEPLTVVEPLEIEKTAETSYDREWDWTITKSADETNLLLAEGGGPG